jgi:hypothetical protein
MIVSQIANGAALLTLAVEPRPSRRIATLVAYTAMDTLQGARPAGILWPILGRPKYDEICGTVSIGHDDSRRQCPTWRLVEHHVA